MKADPRAVATRKWAAFWNKAMRAQTGRRKRIPPHYANGAIEEPLRTVLAAIGHRKFSLGNRTRMSHLVELMRLSALKADGVRVCAEDIRAYLIKAGPDRTRHYRDIYDPWGHASKGPARNLDDLRSIVRELTEREVRVEFVKEGLTFTGDAPPMAHLLLSMMGSAARSGDMMTCPAVRT